MDNMYREGGTAPKEENSSASTGHTTHQATMTCLCCPHCSPQVITAIIISLKTLDNDQLGHTLTRYV
jgi:hypothetical protein